MATSIFCQGRCKRIVGVIVLLAVFYLVRFNYRNDYDIYVFFETQDFHSKYAFTNHETLVSLDNTGYAFADEQPKYNPVSSSHHLFKRVISSEDRSKANNSSEEVYDSIIEHDPKIDESLTPDSYKWYLEKQDKTGECDKPINNFVFLRSHRSASQTLNNIFYRYGDSNSLTFGLPSKSSLDYYWPLRFHHTFIDKTLIKSKMPDLLVGVTRTRIPRIKPYLPQGAMFIAVVRHPVKHFQSVFEYIDLEYFMRMVSNESNVFSEFVSDPHKATQRILNKTHSFDPTFNLIKNPQMFDFGYEKKSYRSPIDLNYIIHDLEEHLNFVIVSDHMFESLVMLQRIMCWHLNDVVHLSQRVRRHPSEIDPTDAWLVEQWNKEDVALFHHFNDTLWGMLKKQDDQFWLDVKKLKDMTLYYEKECTVKNDVPENSFEVINKPRAQFSANTEWMCTRLLLHSNKYVKLLKRKQMAANGMTVNESRNSSEHFVYAKENTKFLSGQSIVSKQSEWDHIFNNNETSD